MEQYTIQNYLDDMLEYADEWDDDSILTCHIG